jgi:hypothetical protein
MNDNEAFRAGLEEEMEKQALLGRMATSFMSGGARAAGGLSRLGRRMGTGTGRVAGAMDRMSTKMLKRQKALKGAVKTRRGAQGAIDTLKSNFKSKAGTMAPSARTKARASLQKGIAKEKGVMKGALGASRQKHGLIPKAVPKPVAVAPKVAPKPVSLPAAKPSVAAAPAATKPTLGGVANTAKKYLNTTAGKIGAGAAVGAGAMHLANRRQQQA